MSQNPESDIQNHIQAESVLAAVRGALSAGDLQQAMALASDAISTGLEHPLFFNLAAHRMETQHEYRAAIELLGRGLDLAPNDLDMLTALGLCLNKLDKPQEALAALDAVLVVRPDFAPAHYGKGVASERMGDFESARRHHEAAANLLPDYADPLSSLAGIAARLGDHASARALAGRALAIDPRQVGARVALASCEAAGGAPQAAEALTRELIAEPNLTEEDRAAAGIVLGDALDAQGRFEEAFAAYKDAKAITRRLNSPNFERPGLETYPQFLQRLYDWFSRLDPDAWAPQRSENDAAGAAGHVFVMGFARSGTTLLETALGSHPKAVSLDESDALRGSAAEATQADDALAKLAALDSETADRWRRAYWDRIAELGVDVRGKVFIDKAPLAAAMLPVISALFPKAKVLFVVRDPRDVVLSCFRRGFAMNPSTFQFTTLESTAQCYDALMRLAMLYRERLPLDLHQLSYERLTDDFEGECRAVCDFIGLEWSAEIADFAEAAKARPSRTPSASQLVRGLYSGGGQWKPYEKQLEPVLPILDPWIERFGYLKA